MKRILTIQDISCIGKCSLTVALPIISAAGIETSILPTAVLSTHTMFDGFTFKDLTDEMRPIKEHWKKEGFTFDAIYTGYMGSKDQIDIVLEYFDTFAKDDVHIIVDPAMADNGKLYVGFDDDFPKYMLKLCQKSTIALPNISEASLMTGLPYPGEDASEDEIKKLLIALYNKGISHPVITGITLGDRFGFMGYDKKSESFFSYATEKVPMKSHGTGDVFASAFTGALENEFSIMESLKIAAKYTCACIKDTYHDPDSVNYAVNFETNLPLYLKLLGKI